VFRDETTIEVVAGDGGDGIVSFRREKYVPRGGPDGGDGGDGGSVILRASPRINSLLAIGRSPRYRAGDGRGGGPRKRTGRSGDDLVLDVPVGTLVYDGRRGNLLRDLAESDATVCVARGGAHGRGNVRFATAVNQAPRKATTGKPGERRELRLELKLVADVGLVGLPNAGKSTFLSAVTAARAKAADYPFTTLVPLLGIADLGEGRTLCLADLPGLIEGAAEGAGLGHRFLRHVERCRALLQLVDVSPDADVEPEVAWRTVGAELETFSGELASRPRLLVAAKCESEEAEEAARGLEAASGLPVWRISSHTHAGLRELLEAAAAAI
jgi:GTP-binding protein